MAMATGNRAAHLSHDLSSNILRSVGLGVPTTATGTIRTVRGFLRVGGRSSNEIFGNPRQLPYPPDSR